MMALMKISRKFSVLLPGLMVFSAVSLLGIEPDAVRIRLSVKRVLSPSGALPTGRYRETTEINRVIGKCNAALARSGADWTLVLTEVKDSQAASSFYSMSGGEIASLESSAKGNPTGYFWRNDAINIYVVDQITDAGGVCSFPDAPDHRDVIIINSQSILGGSEGWLHEMGHYFNLIHPHEGDQVADTIFDPPLPNPFSCDVHDQNLLSSATSSGASAEDTFNTLHNVMGYHCDPTILTPLQIVRMTRALLDFRRKVMEPAPSHEPPVAEISLPGEATGGKVSFSGDPVSVELDGSTSHDADGGNDLTWRWSLLSGPSSGSRFDSPTSGWERGSTGIGYGDNDDLTELKDMQNRYLTVYATRSFNVADPARLTGLHLEVTFDDGFAAYLNGAEIARRKLPPAAGPSTPATASGEATRELLDLTSFLGSLRPGKNRLSIEVHNSALDSSDLSLHPVLSATGTGGEKSLIIPSRAVWYYQKGSAGAPPADWKEPEFDAGRSKVRVTFSQPGTYRFRMTVDDGSSTEGTKTAETEIIVGSAFLRGDCNSDGHLDLSDAVSNLNFLFGGTAALECRDACDVNDDEEQNITDPIALLHFLFLGGESPARPFPDPGVDPAGDALGCGP
jgi:hypothetical protein